MPLVGLNKRHVNALGEDFLQSRILQEGSSTTALSVTSEDTRNESAFCDDCLLVSASIASTILGLKYLSDLLENIVNIVDVHHLENCLCKSSSVKLTECEHVFVAFDHYHLFLCPCERLFSTEVRALG
jgi:hypothetical protein